MSLPITVCIFESPGSQLKSILRYPNMLLERLKQQSAAVLTTRTTYGM